MFLKEDETVFFALYCIDVSYCRKRKKFFIIIITVSAILNIAGALPHLWHSLGEKLDEPDGLPHGGIPRWGQNHPDGRPRNHVLAGGQSDRVLIRKI